MPRVRRPGLCEGVVVRKRPFVTGPQAELHRRRIRGGRSDRAERIRDARTVGAGGVALLRDGMTEIGTLRVVVDQRRRIRLSSLIPGGGPLNGESTDHTGDHRGLDALDQEVLPVCVEEQVAEQAGIEEGDLYIVPVLTVDGAIPLKAVVEELGFPADLVVREAVGMPCARKQVLILAVRPIDMRRAPILVEPARPEPLGPGVIHHDVRHDVPREFCASRLYEDDDVQPPGGVPAS